MARTEVKYHQDDETPENTGWYIVSIDAEGKEYDAIGPYDTEEDARRTADDTEEE